jgi:hypothetical protein
MVKLFGTTIKETRDALTGREHFGPDQPKSDDKTKAIGRIIVSCLLVLFSAYLIRTGNKDIASTIIGALIGYWIK